MEISDLDFEIMSQYIKRACGIALRKNKKYLIHQRLEPLLSEYDCQDFSEFCRLLEKSNDLHLRDEIIAAITTNETFFFRDRETFDIFKKIILPGLGNLAKERKYRDFGVRKGPKVNIWCAGSSSGQEAYSLAMLIHEYSTRENLFSEIAPEDFSILATDISDPVLSKAVRGEYFDAEIQRGLPIDYCERYFVKKGRYWRIDNCIKSMVRFQRLNLIESFISIGGFDIIFCRNVLIYFDSIIISKIFDQFYDILTDNGILILGSSENTYMHTEKFDSTREGNTLLFYKRKNEMNKTTDLFQHTW